VQTLSAKRPRFFLLAISFFIAFPFAGCRLKGMKFPFVNMSVKSPDSTVNRLLKLRDPASVPDWLRKAINDTSHTVILKNIDETEYLIAYNDPDRSPGSFVGFEITHLSTNIIDLPMRKVNVRHFATENGYRLQMPIEDFLEEKEGIPIKTEQNGVTNYTYFDVPRDFLTRYKSDGYLFECEAVEGKVSRIRFGFVDMPKDTVQPRAVLAPVN
jgi:hypothetical protein